MINMFRRLFVFFVLFCSLSGVALALEVGSDAPDFTLQDLDGQQIHLADFKGRPILLKLATTWCPTCKQQTQEIEAAAEVLKAQDAVVIEVFLQDSEAMVRKFLADHALAVDYVPLLDDGQVVKKYNVYLIPRVLVLDADLKVRRDGNLMPASEIGAMMLDVSKKE